MTHPVLQLRAILAQAGGPTSGTVVSVSGAIAKVRTSSGIHVYSTNSLQVKPGNSVALSGQAITAVTPSNDSLSVYEV